MPKEEARNKRGGLQHPHEYRPTPYRPIVVVGLFIKSQRVQLFIPNNSTYDRTLYVSAGTEPWSLVLISDSFCVQRRDEEIQQDAWSLVCWINRR
jgi:hypothetical protein